MSGCWIGNQGKARRSGSGASKKTTLREDFLLKHSWNSYYWWYLDASRHLPITVYDNFAEKIAKHTSFSIFYTHFALLLVYHVNFPSHVLRYYGSIARSIKGTQPFGNDRTSGFLLAHILHTACEFLSREIAVFAKTNSVFWRYIIII